MTAVELPFGETEAWNPYFAAYARSLGQAPGELRSDPLPSSVNARFMGWMTRHWTAWADLNGITTNRERRARAAEFGAWLAAEYPEAS